MACSRNSQHRQNETLAFFSMQGLPRGNFVLGKKLTMDLCERSAAGYLDCSEVADFSD